MILIFDLSKRSVIFYSSAAVFFPNWTLARSLSGSNCRCIPAEIDPSFDTDELTPDIQAIPLVSNIYRVQVGQEGKWKMKIRRWQAGSPAVGPSHRAIPPGTEYTTRELFAWQRPRCGKISQRGLSDRCSLRHTDSVICLAADRAE